MPKSSCHAERTRWRVGTWIPVMRNTLDFQNEKLDFSFKSERMGSSLLLNYDCSAVGSPTHIISA